MGGHPPQYWYGMCTYDLPTYIIIRSGPEKVSCCVVGCNFIYYGPISRTSTLRKPTTVPEICTYYLPTYLQKVTTLPCKMANNVRAHLQITGSHTVISTCIE